MTSKHKRQLLIGGLIALGLGLVVWLVGTNLGLFQSSLLSGRTIVGRDVGTYTGYLTETPSGTVLKSGTGVTMSTNGYLYGEDRNTVRLDLMSHTGSGNLMVSSISGILSYDAAQLTLTSTGSLVPSYDSYVVDGVATRIERDASGNETGRLYFSVDTPGTQFGKPRAPLATVHFEKRNASAQLSSADVSLTMLRMLDTPSLLTGSPQGVLIDGANLADDEFVFPLEMTTNGSYVEETQNTVDPVTGNQTTVETVYDEDGKKIQEIETVRDADGKLIYQKITDYHPDGETIKQITERWYYPDGVTVQTEHIRTFDTEGNPLLTIEREFYPDGTLKSERIIDHVAGTESLKEYDELGRIIRDYFRDADGRITDITYSYNPDGSYTKTIRTVNEFGDETVVEEQYDADGNLISGPRTIYENLATTTGFTMQSDDGLVSVIVGSGALLRRAEVIITSEPLADFGDLANTYPESDAYTIAIRDRLTGSPILQFNEPVDFVFSYDRTSIPATRGDLELKGVALYRYDRNTDTWSIVPQAVVTPDTVRLTTRDPGTFAVGAYYGPRVVVPAPTPTPTPTPGPAPAPSPSAPVSGGGGGGGGGGIINVTELVRLPSLEETLLPAFDTGNSIRAYGPLNFAQAEGSVNVDVEHIEYASGCSVRLPKGTKVMEAGVPFKALLRPIARFPESRLRAALREELPAGARLISDQYMQYGNFQLTFDPSVTFTCGLPAELAELGVNPENIGILSWNDAEKRWDVIGNASNIRGKNFTVQLDKGTVIGVFELPDVPEVTFDVCDDASNPARTPFRDVNFHWSVSFVCKLVNISAISGYTSGPFAGTFQPDRQVSRAELLKIVMIAKGIPVPSTAGPSFPDIQGNEWFAPYVSEAKRLGIVDGYSDGTYRPFDSVNRAEAMKIILGAMGLFGPAELAAEQAMQAADRDDVASFLDVPEYNWFAPYVSYANRLGIISGKSVGRFQAGDDMTRAEVSKVVWLSRELLP